MNRPDLGAMLMRLARQLLAVEQPILEKHDISMWGYAVLTGLGDGPDEPMRTQAALARSIGADKTRIITTLDELQRRGLIEREPDPADRRVRLLRLTPAGRDLLTATQTAIRAAEETVLAQLPPADRRVFLQALQSLSDAAG
ncbi:MarR family winged helix-turn-helix transcriptional regulator [Actinoplanes sp. GCM10030250]|uniref:MarR family winged helix-turn-helix transcriptional regulator n=1 Tax=Actinoplanes sp. GCM10030250 TaxID=3273376 RepID=UPI00360E5721